MVLVAEQDKKTLEQNFNDKPSWDKPIYDSQPKVDPYKYGWRYVKHTGKDGKIFFEQVPLTPYDILHPQEEDFQMHNLAHESIIRYISNACERQLVADPSAVILTDVRVAWKRADLKAHGPDIAVIFGVKTKKNWSTFDEAEEGTRPSLIIEVTSPDTRNIDLKTKVKHYAMAGVDYYVIIDCHKKKPHLLGYELTAAGYVPLKANEQGWLWLEPVKIWLALVAEDEVECYDKHGQLILKYAELEQARQESEQARQVAETRAEAEIKGRIEAEAHLRAMEAKLQQLMAEFGIK